MTIVEIGVYGATIISTYTITTILLRRRKPRLSKDALDDYFGQFETTAPEPDPCTHSDWCRIQRSFHRDASLWMEQDQRISEWLSKKITSAYKAELRGA